MKHLGWRTWTQWPGWTAAYLELEPGSLKLDVPDDVAAVLMPAIEKAVRDAGELRAVPLTCSDYEAETPLGQQLMDGIDYPGDAEGL